MLKRGYIQKSGRSRFCYTGKSQNNLHVMPMAINLTHVWHRYGLPSIPLKEFPYLCLSIYSMFFAFPLPPLPSFCQNPHSNARSAWNAFRGAVPKTREGSEGRKGHGGNHCQAGMTEEATQARPRVTALPKCSVDDGCEQITEICWGSSSLATRNP